MTEKKPRKRVPKTADMLAADLPDGTFVHIKDDDRLYRVKKSTANGLIFERYTKWFADTETFRYRHSIGEMEILTEQRAHRYVFKKYRDDPNLGFGRPVNSEVPTEPSLRMFLRSWGMEVLVAYLLQATGFHLTEDDPPGKDTVTSQEFSHLPAIVTDPKDRERIASGAKHAAVREAFKQAISAVLS